MFRFPIKEELEFAYESDYNCVGKDKSGIVAGVSGKIAELGLNIDDISQTVFG